MDFSSILFFVERRSFNCPNIGLFVTEMMNLQSLNLDSHYYNNNIAWKCTILCYLTNLTYCCVQLIIFAIFSRGRRILQLNLITGVALGCNEEAASRGSHEYTTKCF